MYQYNMYFLSILTDEENKYFVTIRQIRLLRIVLGIINSGTTVMFVNLLLTQRCYIIVAVDENGFKLSKFRIRSNDCGAGAVWFWHPRNMAERNGKCMYLEINQYLIITASA